MLQCVLRLNNVSSLEERKLLNQQKCKLDTKYQVAHLDKTPGWCLVYSNKVI